MSTLLADMSLIPLPADASTRFIIGLVAGLASTGCWVVTSLAFTIAGRRFGSTTVNFTRSVIAMIAVLLAVKLATGAWFPNDGFETTLWLMLSGIAGLTIGDQLVFGAFVRIGPRLTLLVLNLTPVVTALLAWPILGEPLAYLSWVGMAITLLGVAWVVAERHDADEAARKVPLRLGISLALSGMIGIAVGNVLAKLGMLGKDAEPIPPLVAHNLRLIAGTIAIMILAAAARIIGRRIGEPPEADPAARPPRSIALAALALGTLVGPILGIWLFLLSAALIKVAIAATMLALTPLAIIPFNSIVEKTRVSPRAILGAAIAVVGVAILAFSEPRDSTQPGGATQSGDSPTQAVDFPP